MKTPLNIDTKTFIRFWLVVAVLGLLLLGVYVASTALIIIGTSLFLALALNVPVSKISKRLPGKSRVGATAISYVAVIALIGSVIFLVIPPIVQQTAKFAQTVPAFVNSATTQWDGLGGFIDEYNLQPQIDTALASVEESAASWAGNVGQNVISGVGSFFSFLAGLILVLVLTFLMLIEGPQWMKRIWGLYSDKDKMIRHRRTTNRIYDVITGYVVGQLTVSAIGAFFAGLAVFVLSLIFTEIPSSLALPVAAFSFILALIPMFGSTIAGVLSTTLIVFSSIPAAIIFAIFFIIYQQVENNLIAPHIQARKINLSALAVLISVTIGLYMFGIVGGIIAIPIAGSIRILFEEFLQRRHHKIDEEQAQAQA
ncbi:MAG TPA: AI-2E family transporter [Candidatus Saccharimonadaceae bacterium]|nr:AI-2E family transporter [Candidatus Saccharimonadaceae bacterium]|tara:strand:+ start:8213 stop:9319 length:1107 start_codon:yes stop_codon:yes gene_type:complete